MPDEGILRRVSEPPALGLHAQACASASRAPRWPACWRCSRAPRGWPCSAGCWAACSPATRSRALALAGRRRGGPHRAPRPARVRAHHGGPPHRGARAAPAARAALRADHRAGPGPLHPDAHRRRHPLGRRGRAAARGLLRPVPAPALRLRAHPVPDLRGGGRRSICRSPSSSWWPRSPPSSCPRSGTAGTAATASPARRPTRPTAPSSWTRSRGCAPWPPSARASPAPGCSRSAAAPSSRPPCGCSAPIRSRAASATCASRWARRPRWRSAAIACRAAQMELTALVVVLMLGVEIFRPLRELRAVLHQGMLGLSAAQSILALLALKPSVARHGRQAAATKLDPGHHLRGRDVQLSGRAARRARGRSRSAWPRASAWAWWARAARASPPSRASCSASRIRPRAASPSAGTTCARSRYGTCGG